MKTHHFSLLILSGFVLSACTNSSASEDFSQDDPAKFIFLDGEYQVLADKTTLYGEVLTLDPEHWGSLPLERGEWWIKEGRLDYGSLRADLSSLRVFDAEGVEVTALEHVLKSDEHLGIGSYPTARLDTTFIKPYAGFEDYNHEIDADLSLHGHTLPIHLLAKLTQNEDQLTIHASGVIDLVPFGLGMESASEAESTEGKNDFLLEMDLVAQKKVMLPVQ